MMWSDNYDWMIFRRCGTVMWRDMIGWFRYQDRVMWGDTIGWFRCQGRVMWGDTIGWFWCQGTVMWGDTIGWFRCQGTVPWRDMIGCFWCQGTYSTVMWGDMMLIELAVCKMPEHQAGKNMVMLQSWPWEVWHLRKLRESNDKCCHKKYTYNLSINSAVLAIVRSTGFFIFVCVVFFL